MAYRQEELVAEIIEEAGLLPRPMRPGREESGRNRRVSKQNEHSL